LVQEIAERRNNVIVPTNARAAIASTATAVTGAAPEAVRAALYPEKQVHVCRFPRAKIQTALAHREPETTRPASPEAVTVKTAVCSHRKLKSAGPHRALTGWLLIERLAVTTAFARRCQKQNVFLTPVAVILVVPRVKS